LAAASPDDIDRLWDYYAGIAGRSTADKVIRDIVKVVTEWRITPFGSNPPCGLRAWRSLQIPRYHEGDRAAHRDEFSTGV
jgi:hypothetical protein